MLKTPSRRTSKTQKIGRFGMARTSAPQIGQRAEYLGMLAPHFLHALTGVAG